MDYSQAVAFLYQQLPMFQRVGPSALKKDLTNTQALLTSLHNPHYHFPSVHVAGTNGKGSSAHSLAAVLQSAGYRTGLYTSPHLKSFTERIRVNGTEIRESSVVDFVRSYRYLMQEVEPSFFEVTVAMAFHYFAQQQVDIAVIEVGLGGRLDSTNVITPEVSLITNIGLDHTDILGETLEEIAAEKAGIIKSDVPVVVGQRQPQTIEVFKRVARERKAPLYFAEDQYAIVSANDSPEGQIVQLQNTYQNQSGEVTLSLRGQYQVLNLPGIFSTVDRLRERGWVIPHQATVKGLAQVASLTGLKGRWQVLQRNPICIADTGHNPEAWHEIMRQLRTYPVNKFHFVLGVTQGKDVTALLALLPEEGNYYFCQARVVRAMPAHLLAEKAQAAARPGIVIEDVQQAYKYARQLAQANDLVFVGGSSFVVAELDDL